MSKTFFHIKKDSKFCYEGRGTVLKVCEFKIHSGEIVVILGNSGAGKSTFIESLGLMSNTLQFEVGGENSPEWEEYKTGEKVETGKIIFDPAGENIPFPDVWNNKKFSVSEVRKKNFNFIFQDNNLMNNLKNCDNIILADLIDGTKNYRDSYDKTLATFTSLNIDQYINDPPTSISGGERQRVAFARGIQPNYKVLFGDEPTGNLDEAASGLLMDVVKKDIDDSKASQNADKAVVIVSHNIPLSLKYADRIVILTKSSENNHYEILPENIYLKIPGSDDSQANEPNWIVDPETLQMNKEDDSGKDSSISSSKMTSAEFAKRIKNILDNNVKQKSNTNNHQEPSNPKWVVKQLSRLGFFFMVTTRYLSKLLGKKQDDTDLHTSNEFFKLLFEKESEVLTGKMKIGKWDFSFNIWFFSVLVFVTFLILGFANGQMNDLKNRLMNDPFVLTVDVAHRGGDLQSKTRQLLNDFVSNSDSMKYYGISDISEYDREYLTFVFHDNPSKQDFYMGRSMHYDDPLLDRIVDKSVNNAIGRKFDEVNDIGIIVTRDLLNDLNYDHNTSIIFIDVYIPEDEAHYKAPIPIKAIVDHLPGSPKNYFLYTPSFYDYYAQVDGNFPMQKKRHVKISIDYDVSKNPGVLNEFRNLLIKELEDDKYNRHFNIRRASVEIDSNFFAKNMIYDFIIMPRGGNSEFGQQIAFYDTLMQAPSIKEFIGKYSLTKNRNIFQSFFFERHSSITSDYDRKIGLPFDKEKAHISFLFDNTDNIRKFAAVFNSKTRQLDDERREGLSMDISKVESMHIFNKVSRLTSTIILFLIVFSIATISIFIYNLFDMHLHKIRKNIGTLMAFGINVKHIYRYVLFTFTFFCFTISFILSFILGYLIIKPISNFSFFLESSWWMPWYFWITIIAIFAGTYIVFRIADRNYFSKTPSKLIFKS